MGAFSIAKADYRRVLFCGSRQESVGIAMCRIRWSLSTSYKVSFFNPSNSSYPPLIVAVENLSVIDDFPMTQRPFTHDGSMVLVYIC